jgi:hypothetical protein
MQKTLKNGQVAEAIALITQSGDFGQPGNIVTKFREAFESYTPGQRWAEVKGTGDLILVDGNAAGASYLVVSKDPHSAGTESVVETIAAFSMPVDIAIGLSMSQRTLGQEFSVELVDTGASLPDVPDLEIASLTQAATALTFNTVANHGLSVGKSFGVRGVLDSRVNYPALVVASVLSPTQFTATAGPGGTIASQTAYVGRVLAATTAALPAATYANGTSGVGATLTAIANGAFPDQDGIAIPLNGRVLVKNQASGLENGVYVLTTVGSAGAPWVLTRATDFDTTAEMTVVAGALFAVSIYVSSGTTQAQRNFYLSATVTTVGTTAVTFVDAGTVGPVGYVFFRERMGRANNGVSQIFESAAATNSSLYIRSESGDALPSGTVAGSHSVTTGTTASVQIAGSLPYTYSFTPTSEYRFAVQADRTQWSDVPVDSTAALTGRGLRTQVCPDPSEQYKLRIRATNNKSLTVPNAKVVSVTKSGTTTGTFVTETPHGLVTGDLVVYYGSSDTAAANFPNLATATAITVTGPTTFTAVIGTGTTGTAYGGFVARVQGGNLMSSLGASAQTAINATLTTLSDGTRQLVLTGSGNWAGVAIGDLVNTVGVHSVPGLGSSLGVDGVWRVANFATTALTLVSLAGQTWPADFAQTSCGGAIIRRTCLRLSFVRVFDYERQRVELLPRPTADAAASAPVTINNIPAVSQSGSWTVSAAGTVAVDAAIGNPVTAGLRASNANIAAMSAAGDNVAWLGTMIGAGIVKPYALPEAEWATTLALTAVTDVAVQTAAGAGLKRHVTLIQATNTGAAAVDVLLRDGTTTRLQITVPAGQSVYMPLPTGIPLTANTALNVALSAAGTVRFNALGYTAP